MNDGRTSPPLPEDLAEATDEELVELLVSHVGVRLPEGLPEEIVVHGERMVELLCEILLRRDLWELGEGALGMWAPVHALYLLGLIGSPKAAPALIELLRSDKDAEDIYTAGATVLGRMGPEALELIEGYIGDRETDPVRRGAIAGGALVYIGHQHPELRPRIASFLVEMLEREDEDLEFSTFLADEAACVDDLEIQAALHAAIERGAVDDFIIDLDELRERVSGTDERWRGRPSELDLMAELRDMQVLSYKAKDIEERLQRATVEELGKMSQPSPIAPRPTPTSSILGRRKKRNPKEKAKRKQARKARKRRRR